MGLPPGLPAARLRRIADRFWAAVILAAFDAGTHLGYAFEDEDFRPHGI